jgi:hypothetical protein
MRVNTVCIVVFVAISVLCVSCYADAARTDPTTSTTSTTTNNTESQPANGTVAAMIKQNVQKLSNAIPKHPKKAEPNEEDDPRKRCFYVKKMMKCGDKDACSGRGKCVRTYQQCVGVYNIVDYTCLCDSKATGDECGKKDSKKRQYSCGKDYTCGGRGVCVLANSVATVEKYRCRCDEGFYGPQCHTHRADTIKPDTTGQFHRVMAHYGGYFNFRQKGLSPTQQ